MSQLNRPHTTHRAVGQPSPSPCRPAVWIGFLSLALCVSCHPLPRPGDPDPRLPAAFRTPEATFHTWAQASLAGDEATLGRCYWKGLARQERASWLRENLKIEARELFRAAIWKGVRFRSPVEANFVFQSGDGDEFRGVMVRTRDGWQIQRW